MYRNKGVLIWKTEVGTRSLNSTTNLKNYKIYYLSTFKNSQYQILNNWIIDEKKAWTTLYTTYTTTILTYNG